LLRFYGFPFSFFSCRRRWPHWTFSPSCRCNFIASTSSAEHCWLPVVAQVVPVLISVFTFPFSAFGVKLIARFYFEIFNRPALQCMHIIILWLVTSAGRLRNTFIQA
jgi:hypothetical protein